MTKKFTELTALTTAAAEDILAIVDDPSGTPISKKITAQELFDSGLDATVGDLTGTGAFDLSGASSVTFLNGTFTPVATFSTLGTASITQNTQEGNYTRIGNRILFDIKLNFTINSLGTASGAFRITGNPVVSDGNVTACISRTTKFTLPAGTDQFSAQTINTTDYFQIYAIDSATTPSTLAVGDFTTGTYEIYLSGNYKV